ncbi:MAG: EAL domain-containing protein [Actinomycetota bacterium]
MGDRDVAEDEVGMPGRRAAVAAVLSDPEPVLVVRATDTGGHVIHAGNEPMLRTLQLAPAELEGRDPTDVVVDAGPLLVDPAGHAERRVSLRTADGRQHWYRLTAWSISDELVVWRLTPDELDLLDGRLGSVVNALVEHAITVDRSGRVLSGTDGWTSMFTDRVVEIDDLLAWLGEHGEELSLADAHRALGDVLSGRATIRHLDMSVGDHWTAITISGVPGSDRVAAVISAVDVTDRKRAEADLTERMLTDSLTALPNRTLTLDRLHHALTHNDRAEEGVAAMFVDLDDFGSLNTRLGHLRADDLLADVARTIRRAVRPSDTVGRWGGDEFVVVAERLHSVDEATSIANRILAQLRTATTERIGSPIGASIGISYSSDGFTTAREMLQDADTAMYAAKAAGRARVEVFTARDRERELGRLAFSKQLRLGVNADELFLEYQPQIDLVTGRIIAVEALVRWRRPSGEILRAKEFLDSGAGDETVNLVDRWVIQHACQQLATWQRAGNRVLLSVNVSVRDLADPGFLELLDDVVAESGVDATGLMLELTEDALLDRHSALVAVPELVRRGVRIALDDFGAGYGPLTTLGTAPVDTIKLDGNLIAELDRGRGADAVVRGLIRMAAELGIEVVAKGVERQRQLVELRRISCPMAQGHLLGQPVGIDDLPRFHEPNVAVTALDHLQAAAGW